MAGGAFKNINPELVPLSRETLQERVYRRIVELILDGSIVPGEMVTVQSLADLFGVSPMPVREALRRLMAANALTVVSGRSIGIPLLSRARLTDLRNVRLEIEPTAAAWAAAHIDAGALTKLEIHLRALEQANADGDVRSYLRANHAFHFSIYRAARSENMLKIIEDLWLQISPYFNLLHDSGNYSTANEHHQQMLEALKNHESEAVRTALRADIEAAYHVLIELVL